MLPELQQGRRGESRLCPLRSHEAKEKEEVNLPPRIPDDEFDAVIDASLKSTGSVFTRPMFEVIEDVASAFHAASWPEPGFYHDLDKRG